MHYKQISDYGTENPIVARLSLQTTDLLNVHDLSTKQRDDLFGVFFSNIQPKLMSCYRIKEQLTKEIRKQLKAIEVNGLPTQANGIYKLPYILELDHNVETFLYNSKLVLRDLTEVFSFYLVKISKKKLDTIKFSIGQ